MTKYFGHMKSVFLAALIVIGMGVHHSQANADTLTRAEGCFLCAWSEKGADDLDR